MSKLKKQERFFIGVDLFLFLLFLLAVFHVFILPASQQNNGKTSTVTFKMKQEAKQEAQKIAKLCLGKKDADNCYKAMLTKITQKSGVIVGEQTLYALQDFDPILRNCHVYAHEVGKAAERANPSKWKELMDQVDVDTCGAGFLHGILEAHTGDDPNFKVDAKFINETCYKEHLNFKEMTCSHILGHLVLLDTEGKIKPALPVCGAIDKGFQLDCYNGIFMEDSFKLALAEHGFGKIPVRDEKRMITQEKRCTSYDGIQAVACWTDMAEIFAEFYNFDPPKTYESCMRAPFEGAREHCYLKAVILMAPSLNFDTKEQLLSECVFYEHSDDLYKRCTDFIVSSLMHYSPKFADRGVTLCSNIKDPYKEYCFKDLGEKIKMNIVDRAEREQLCTGTPDKYKQLCID